MTTSSVFLVTYNDGDYYTRYAETLAAFPTREEALNYVLCRQAFEIEFRSEVMRGLEVVEMCGEEELSRLEVCPLVGVELEHEGDDYYRVAARAAAYRSLERILFS